MQEELNDDDGEFEETGNSMRDPKKRDIKKESKNSKTFRAMNKEHDPLEESKATAA